MKRLTGRQEATLFSALILIYWSLFWFLNVVDKFVVGPADFWKGKNRVTQFSDYLASVGIQSDLLVWLLIGVITVIETAAVVLAVSALVALIRNKSALARSLFFGATVVGMVIFTGFSIGDQIFGDRAELWEHGTFLILIIVSWFAYRYYNKDESEIEAQGLDSKYLQQSDRIAQSAPLVDAGSGERP